MYSAGARPARELVKSLQLMCRCSLQSLAADGVIGHCRLSSKGRGVQSCMFMATSMLVVHSNHWHHDARGGGGGTRSLCQASTPFGCSWPHYSLVPDFSKSGVGTGQRPRPRGRIQSPPGGPGSIMIFTSIDYKAPAPYY